MPCYARACRQRFPCKSMRACQRVWHACTPPHEPHPVWVCRDCGSVWPYTDEAWWRDPMKAVKR